MEIHHTPIINSLIKETNPRNVPAIPPTNQPLVKGKITAFFLKIRRLTETFMPNFNQIGTELAILAYLAQLTNQPTNQPTDQPTTCYRKNNLDCLFL